jgi:hypothetical protein
LCFGDAPHFRPNLTPAQVLKDGAFGGTYFRQISSAVTGETYQDVHLEFPEEWFKGLHPKAYKVFLFSSLYFSFFLCVHLEFHEEFAAPKTHNA